MTASMAPRKILMFRCIVDSSFGGSEDPPYEAGGCE
jgi:hypothetical protein